ncbi:DNA-binding transcriptional LysR family regulator [Sedimentibacter acidaminivorans]|uniref:DNA-binding transcriptional LysR family regulator n=1 Tax=Sedimentibacter acidaminivorans TaxID=913099 RepID=A0ABS4GJ59_9FIRM|nr:DNA-binding transcriptional LysR family regulator [Sedimentibacter acidaminivorans]
MLDYRINTFLQLCDLMNYRKTAELLHMTQPAVTQHIHFLEEEYNCKLFIYNGKKLKKTKAAHQLEAYARSAKYTENIFKKEIINEPLTELRIGATKTIGEYVITEQIRELFHNDKYTLSLIVDNTENLLYLLEHNKLDFALIEGFFDKQKYSYMLYRKEPFVGICSKTHPFAQRNVSFEELFKETLIVREKGSGTRAIFEQILFEHNFTLECFKKQICISSFQLIKELVLTENSISFVYEAVANSDNDLSSFAIGDNCITREFNYVYLKNTNAQKYISLFENKEDK